MPQCPVPALGPPDHGFRAGDREAGAAEAGAEPGAIDVATSVLLVDGVGWELVSPGFALCSPAVTEDRAQARDVLRTVPRPRPD